MTRLPMLLLLVSSAWGQVAYDRIVHASSEPASWLTYSGNYQGHRFSPLSEVTAANVGRLRVKWAYQMDARAEVSPIVADGVMYVSGPNTAAALDIRTGRELWTWKRPVPKDYQNIGFGRVNRGPAILGDEIFVATLDCYVVALDSKSGRERWSVKVEGAPDLRVQGNIVDHEYAIEREGQRVAEVSKRWFRVGDTYGVEVAPGENDILVLATAAVIDTMAHPDR